MPLISYRNYRPHRVTRQIIEQAVEILERYSLQGYSLTLRQLYYQFIAKDLFPESWIKDGTKNNAHNYSKLGEIIASAREGGLIDWNHISDRGRFSASRPHWRDPEFFLKSVTPQFNIDLWADQPKCVEVFVEKDALSDIVSQACRPFDVPYTACRGYMSSSAIWEAAHDRILDRWNAKQQETIIIHLGDHDPSGVDMTRDIQNRLEIFSRQHDQTQFRRNGTCPTNVIRIALTMDQVEEFNPPPNFAKETDARFQNYADEYGEQCWELDALEPSVIVSLIQNEIEQHMDRRKFKQAEARQEEWRSQLIQMSSRWDYIQELLQSDEDE